MDDFTEALRPLEWARLQLCISSAGQLPHRPYGGVVRSVYLYPATVLMSCKPFIDADCCMDRINLDLQLHVCAMDFIMDVHFSALTLLLCRT
jgi:hypothetical protein